jgi:hypothetical protein
MSNPLLRAIPDLEPGSYPVRAHERPVVIAPGPATLLCNLLNSMKIDPLTGSKSLALSLASSLSLTPVNSPAFTRRRKSGLGVPAKEVVHLS